MGRESAREQRRDAGGAGRVISLRFSSSQSPMFDGGMVVGGEFGGGLPQPTAGVAGRNAMPPSSELSNGEGVAARREGDVPAEAGKYSNS